MKPYEITLDLRRNLHQVLVMKEGDANSRVIHAKITDNGKPYSVPSAYLTVQWTKPDGNVVQNIIHTMVDDSTVEIVCTDQMLAVSGIARADITIATENEILSPIKFNISIDESAVSKNIIESSNEFGALNDLLAKNNSLGDDLRELELQLEKAESERVIAENERKANEEIRKTNEDNREDAENLRETNTSTAIQNTNNATILANTATQNAEDATEAAIDATTKTNEATQKANTTIAKMESLMKDDNIIHIDDLGVAGGVATLDENGNIPASQLPSFVDEYKEGVATNVQTNEETGIKSALGFILSGETEECVPSSDKIYVDINENISYRWSGSMFVCIGGSLTLGINAHTAFSGDRGVALEERMDAVEEYHNNIPASDIKFDNTNTNILSAEVQGAIVELSQPATRTKDGLLSASDKVLIDNYANIQEIEAVLSASKWIGDSAPYTQTITITDLTAYNNCSVELNPIATTEQGIAIIEADIDDTILYDESTGLTLVANGTKPTIDIPILLCVGTSMNIVGVPYYLGDLDKAENISYDNSDSNLNGTNVKSAIDELDSKKQNADTAITTSNIGSQSVKNAENASNSDTVDGVHFHPTDATGAPTGFGYVYGFKGGDDYNAWVFPTTQMSVNYASSAEKSTYDSGGYHIHNTFDQILNGYLPLGGGAMNGNVVFPTNYGIRGNIADNDYWRMYGGSAGSNAGFLEIATADDGNEPIYVRQYTGVFASCTRTATLLDGSGNTSFPGNITASGFSTTGGAAYQGDGNIYMPWAGNYISNILNGKLNTSASCNKNWNWYGQGGQPTWVWGGEDGTNMYVWNPANFSVNYAAYSGKLINNTAGVYLLTNTDYNFKPYKSSDGTAYDNTVTLGTSSDRFKQLYAGTATISTSDKNLKDNITPLTDKHFILFTKLIPCSFTFKDGQSGRTHIGFISQDVEAAMNELGMNSLDFAGFCKDIKEKSYIDENGKEITEEVLDENGNPEYVYSLRYEEFIGIISHVLQINVKEIDKLKNDVQIIKNILNLEDKE